VARWTASGKPKATAYQIHPTRQRITLEPGFSSPERTWLRGITMRAAMSGAKPPKDPNGKNAHAIA
jgi:hypothetical protein